MAFVNTAQKPLPPAASSKPPAAKGPAKPAKKKPARGNIGRMLREKMG